MLAAIFNPYAYELPKGMLQPANQRGPSHRVAALYHVRAALFWAGGPKLGLNGYMAPAKREDVVGQPQPQLAHRVAALF